MNLSDIRFPIYVVHTDDVVRQDGILWCEGAIIDDRNTIGARMQIVTGKLTLRD